MSPRWITERDLCRELGRSRHYVRRTMRVLIRQRRAETRTVTAVRWGWLVVVRREYRIWG